jgi:S1-C subfamily serine protease
MIVLMLAWTLGSGCAATTSAGPSPIGPGKVAVVPVAAAAAPNVAPVRPPAYWERDVLAQAAVAVSRSVVEVLAIVRNEASDAGSPRNAVSATGRARGSGILLSGDLVITSEHVVRDAAVITVTLADGSLRLVDGIAVHDRLDLAVLRLSSGRLRPDPAPGPWSPLAIGSPAAEGAPVAALMGGDPSTARVRFGAVANVGVSLQQEIDAKGRRDYASLIETTVALDPGFSGGPLIDAGGRLVGLCVAAAGDGRRHRFRGYALPFDRRVRSAVADLAEAVRAAD